jgi:hypothetical protein
VAGESGPHKRLRPFGSRTAKNEFHKTHGNVEREGEVTPEGRVTKAGIDAINDNGRGSRKVRGERACEEYVQN